jgi:hypothetical protein
MIKPVAINEIQAKLIKTFHIPEAAFSIKFPPGRLAIRV